MPRINLAPRALRWYARLTLVVMLLATLAPVASRIQALPQSAHGGNTAFWSEVCTTLGIAQLPAQTEALASADGQPSAPSLDHCPLCVLMAERLAPPAHSVALTPPDASARNAAPPPPRRVAHSRWHLTAAPRGPPVAALA